MATRITGKSKTELLGYVPMEKRIAQLQVAGLRTMIARDSLYDSLVDMEDHRFPPPPKLPRHFEADMADVAELDRFYRARRAVIEESIRDAKRAKQEEAALEDARKKEAAAMAVAAAAAAAAKPPQ